MPSKNAWTSIKHRIQKRKAFCDYLFRCLAPFWEAFGRQNLEIRLSEIRWKSRCDFGDEFRRQSGMRGASGVLFLRIFCKHTLFWARAPCRGRRILIAPRIPPGHEQLFGELHVQRYDRYGRYCINSKKQKHILCFAFMEQWWFGVHF